MRQYFMFILLLLILHCNARRLRSVSTFEQEKLEKAQRNAECCAKKMRCCVKLSPPPIEIRALIVRCPNLNSSGASRGTVSRTLNKPVMAANEFSIKSFQGFDEDEPLILSHVTDCRNKIVMTLRLHHKGAIECQTQYIVVDHVYDPVTQKPVRLLNPYVIRLKQEPVSKSFHLKFVDYVNSEAHEEVHNKQESNYTGCYASKYRSTCGLVKFDGHVIPYSEGFCCSCDSKKNRQRQPDSYNARNEEIISYSDPAYLLDRVSCPRTYYDDGGFDVPESGSREETSNSTEQNSTTTSTETTDKSGARRGAYEEEHYYGTYGDQNGARYRGHLKKRWKYTTYSRLKNNHKATTTYRPDYLKKLDNNEEKPTAEYLRTIYRNRSPETVLRKTSKEHMSSLRLDPLDETRDLFAQRLARKMRQTFPSGVQKRGGQNCADRYTPPGVDPEHYHESTHCLRFSDVWYGIYKLGEPNIEQVIYMNIYERFETASRADKWREITNDTVHLSNRNPHYEDETPTISVTFTAKAMDDPSKFGSWESKRILIPEGVSECEMSKYPEMRGGPDEYLVVSASKIALEGDQCDRIGVGFEGFFKQPQRCALPRGTCLHNQPKHLWRNDKSLERKHKRGCYFLKYHANITQDPLYVNTSSGEKYLFVEYHGRQTSNLDIEIKADMNSVVRVLTNAAITEVYVDSTCSKFTLLTIKVINTGLISTKFSVQLSDFPLELPDEFSHIRSRQILIPPQALHIFNLEIRAPLPSDLMYCSVEVLNVKKELVALRRVRIQKYDRCICAWYCLCACVASVTGLNCNPMSLEHYHAAGFEGSLPIVTYMVHFTMLDDLLSVSFYFILFILGLLLLLGIFKAILGLCCLGVGMWGLAVVLDLPKPMSRYYERDLRKEAVMYDMEGWPIDPNTHLRARNISLATEFCANVVFFFTYPLACTVIIFKRLCCPYYTKKKCAAAEQDKEPKAGCGGGKTCKKKKKSSKDPPCDNPECKKKKDKKKKKDSGTGDEGGRGRKKKDQSAKSSGSSSKSTKSGKERKKQRVVAAYTFQKFKSPFERAAELIVSRTPSMAVAASSEPATTDSRESFFRKAEFGKYDDAELSTVSEGSYSYTPREKLSHQETKSKESELTSSISKDIRRAKLTRTTSESDESPTGSVLPTSNVSDNKPILTGLNRMGHEETASRTSDVLSTTESRSRTSLPTSSTFATSSGTTSYSPGEENRLENRSEQVLENASYLEFDLAAKASAKSRPKSL